MRQRTNSMRRGIHMGGVALLALVVTAGCSDDDFPTTPTELPPSVTETFSGTLTPNGAATHLFVASRSGTITATLATLNPSTTGPDTPLLVGLSLGLWNGAFCETILANDQATQGSTVTGNASSATTLCARVYDARARVVEPTAYEVQVEHP
jgi:hypothetical protein